MNLVTHDHNPLYRVLPQDAIDFLDDSYSRHKDNRWNTADFPALYCCCSKQSARAVALEKLSSVGLLLEDVQPPDSPMLVEVEWVGQVVDVASADGVLAAGFTADYPDGTTRDRARLLAAQWFENGHEGIVCRSASLFRLGNRNWHPPHQPWGEAVVYKQNATQQPKSLRKHDDSAWLSSVSD